MRSRAKGGFFRWTAPFVALLVWLGFILSACAPASSTVEPGSPTPSSTSTPDFTPTPTTVWFPATKTPTPRPTPDFTPAPEGRTDLGAVLLEDTFEDANAWQTGQFPEGRAALGKNELTLALSGEKSYLSSLRSQPELADFYLEIDAQPSLCRGTDSYGLLLRAADASNFYRFVLTCEGNLRLERVLGDRDAVLQDWTPRSSPPDAARLSVWAVGPELRFFINNTFQFSIQDAALTRGAVGLFARSSGEKALTVNFSNLVVYAVNPGENPQTTPSAGVRP